ncbi:alpha/beta fold hydrolase [Nonomuraea rubra]|uniref:alpha/beta fold hydrolase n=1 Tax=Nonomuraea rubra TaxID=46180 RepID=UPI00360A660F
MGVFAPNVRGSGGYGRAFRQADDRERRFDAVHDVADCAAELVRLGAADPSRLACMGWSYGGYLTLATLVAHPRLFRAGVTVSGIADFATFYARAEPWIAAAAVGEYGHPDTDRELLHALSPLHALDRLAAPSWSCTEPRTPTSRCTRPSRSSRRPPPWAGPAITSSSRTKATRSGGSATGSAT